MITLRPYQNEAREAVLSEWDKGNRRTLLVLPTGTGKTIVFSSIVDHQIKHGRRALIMAHRGELLDQAGDKLKTAAGIDCVYEKAGMSSLGSKCPVTVASVQSLSRSERLDKFPADYFTDIVVDEAHHCLSESYKRVLSHFPDANVLGVTATPDRGDMKNLGEFFDSKAYEYSLAQAIKEKYLCPVKAQMIPLKLDISDVSINNGDYAAGEIGSALEPYLTKIAKEMLNYCRGRKTVVFLPLVKTSKKFCRILNDCGFKAAEVNGESRDRAEVLKAFEEGEYDVLCNSMLLTEGWDCPAVDCVIVLRPTKIRSLYQQMVGRGLRPYPGKDHLLLLDFLWLTARHELCRPSCIISKDETIAGKIDTAIKESAEGIDLIEAEKNAERDVLTDRENALAGRLAAMRSAERKLVDPLQYALSIAAEDLASYSPTFAWEMAPPSARQLQFLQQRGIESACIDNAGKASLIIDRLIRRQREGLSTPKQIRCLEKFGFSHVGTWRFEQASAMISALANNNWRVPRGIIAGTYKP